MHRRNFDRELVDRVNGRLPWKKESGREGKTLPVRSWPATRYIVCGQSDRILADLSAHACRIEPVGSDLHIFVKTTSELEAIIALLQRHRVHGVLRRLP